MRPVTLLPPHYVVRGQLDPFRSKALPYGLSIGGIILFFSFGGLFIQAAGLAIPNWSQGSITLSLGGMLGPLLGGTAVTILVPVQHELTHGAVFWLVTGERPLFRVGPFLAFAACPHWFIPRLSYLLIALAPFVVLTIIGLVLIRLISPSLVPSIVYALALNTAGAVGDIYATILSILVPSTTLVNDRGDQIIWYAPDESA